jgi:hypothetical protein
MTSKTDSKGTLANVATRPTHLEGSRTMKTVKTIQPRQPGRPTKRTDETLRILFEAAATGAPIKSCCAAARISVETLNTWKESDPTIQTQFDEARERGRVEALAALKKAISQDWRAGAEWLRLSFRAEYSARAEIAVEAGDSAMAALIVNTSRLAALQEGYKQLQQSLG